MSRHTRQVFVLSRSQVLRGRYPAMFSEVRKRLTERTTRCLLIIEQQTLVKGASNLGVTVQRCPLNGKSRNRLWWLKSMSPIVSSCVEAALQFRVELVESNQDLATFSLFATGLRRHSKHY